MEVKLRYDVERLRCDGGDNGKVEKQWRCGCEIEI